HVRTAAPTLARRRDRAAELRAARRGPIDMRAHGLTSRMSERPTFAVEYLEPVEAEPLPDEFSASRLRRSLLLLAAVAVVVVAAILLVPGLGSLRSRFMGAR